MNAYLYSPFPRPKHSKINIFKVFLLGFLGSTFIVIFKPFNIENDQLWYYNLIVFGLGLLFSLAIYLMEFVIPSLFKHSFLKWNLLKAILWYSWVILFVSGVMFLAKSFLAGFNDFTFLEYVYVIGRVAAISLIVSFFALGIINYVNKKRIALLSSKETYTLKAPNAQTIRINLNEVLYIVSDDNYVDIHLLINNERSKQVFRSSLKNIESQIINPISPIYKCHRRYLVNINYFHIKINKSRSTIISPKGFDDEIPVSTKYQTQIRELLQIRP